jgi:AcrR family transcriptional regulator
MMAAERDALLARVIDEVAAHGLADRSLRDLARAVGTSHRMLIYHFGSREGLVGAIVTSTEEAQRRTLRQLAEQAATPAELIRALWQQVSAPELRPFVRLFFELVTHMSDGAPAASDLTAPWLANSAEAAAALGVDYDPADIRLGVAAVRGLLIDVLTTGELDLATESLERFIGMLEHPGRP